MKKILFWNFKEPNLISKFRFGSGTYISKKYYRFWFRNIIDPEYKTERTCTSFTNFLRNCFLFPTRAKTYTCECYY